MNKRQYKSRYRSVGIKFSMNINCYNYVHCLPTRHRIKFQYYNKPTGVQFISTSYWFYIKLYRPQILATVRSNFISRGHVLPRHYIRFLPTYVPMPVELPSRATTGMLILHLNAALILCKNALVRKCCKHTFIQIRSPSLVLLFQESAQCEPNIVQDALVWPTSELVDSYMVEIVALAPQVQLRFAGIIRKNDDRYLQIHHSICNYYKCVRRRPRSLLPILWRNGIRGWIWNENRTGTVILYYLENVAKMSK